MAHIDFSCWVATSSGHDTYYNSKGGSHTVEWSYLSKLVILTQTRMFF